MSLPTINFEGRVNKAELRFTPNSKAVLNLDIACNGRKFDKDTNQWVDGDVYWINGASLWGAKAESAAEQIQEGDIVCGTATLRTRKYTDKEGNARSAVDHMIESVGKVALPSRNGGGQSSPANGAWGQQAQSQPVASGAWGSQDTSAPF